MRFRNCTSVDATEARKAHPADATAQVLNSYSQPSRWISFIPTFLIFLSSVWIVSVFARAGVMTWQWED